MPILEGNDLIGFIEALEKEDSPEAQKKRALAKVFLEVVQSKMSYEERKNHLYKCLETTENIKRK